MHSSHSTKHILFVHVMLKTIYCLAKRLLQLIFRVSCSHVSRGWHPSNLQKISIYEQTKQYPRHAQLMLISWTCKEMFSFSWNVSLFIFMIWTWMKVLWKERPKLNIIMCQDKRRVLVGSYRLLCTAHHSLPKGSLFKLPVLIMWTKEREWTWSKKIRQFGLFG